MTTDDYAANSSETFDIKMQPPSLTTSTTAASSTTSITTNYVNNENISVKLINSKISSATPKRRLNYQNMNSSPVANKLPTPGITSTTTSTTADLSPFIKRKCLARLSNFSCTTSNSRTNNVSDSPYMIATGNLNNELAQEMNSPKGLNDSFESIQPNADIKITSRYLSRRRFSKHKSAPLTNLTQQINNSSNYSNQYMSSPISKIQGSSGSIHQPLNDISNQISRKLTNSLAQSIQNGFKLNEESSVNEENSDDVTELENLIYGNPILTTSSTTLIRQVSNPNFIKQSLERELQGKNLIGDRSRAHILPPITSKKHPDLNCISPETLVDVLNGLYAEKIHEVVIIDSRYPYEYEGGHIAHALNIYTKERLYDEMFIKRSHKNTVNFNNSTMDMDSSNESMSPPEIKRTIIIFHCEFSSERGPSLLKFLRNSDRTLNEHCYPNLFYPELYLLEGGYKSFYERFKNYCEPPMYKPMLHEEHQYDYKHFRAKAKSWEASRYHIVYKYNEHLQKQKILHTQKELENEHEHGCKNTENQEPNTTTMAKTSHRIIKMKANF